MRAAIYTRVSSDPNGGQRSVSEQAAECRRWVEREGWQLVEVYSDNDRSASRYARKNRPDWQRLTEDLDAGGIDVLVVWEISRATRDRTVWATLVDQCMSRGVRLCIGGRLHDLDDPDDAFTLDLTSSLAVRESGVTRKRVLRAVQANAEKGRPHGPRLYGFRREYDPATKQFVQQVPCEEEAVVVKDAIGRVAAGATLYQIARDLNEGGIPAPRNNSRGWTPSHIRRFALNPGYVGRRVHQGRDIGEAIWEPLVDEATFWQAHAIVSDPRRRTNRGSELKYLLSGVATCGVCGGRLRVQRNRGFLAYLCLQRFCVSRRIEFVDDLVTELVIGRLSRPDALELLTPDVSEDVAAARDEVAVKRARLKEATDLAADGQLSVATLARLELLLLPEIEAAEQRARASQAVPTVLADLARADIAEVWETLPLATRRHVVALLMEVRVLKARQGARTFDVRTVEIRWRHADARC